jgi:membrane-associated phospholipid phosphatase
MAFALVYTGEHYVSDVLVGWAYAAAAYFGVEALARRRAAVRRE